jgi:Arc/MetJ family transcription regulator
MYMTRRTTIEIDEELLARAKRALGSRTTRATVEEALRRAADQAEDERERLAGSQLKYLEELPARVDLAVLTSEEMWR